MAALNTADSWLYVPEQQADDLLKTNITWPFTNISEIEFKVLQKGMGDRDALHIFMHICATTISAFGIVFTILLIGSFWSKAIVQKNSFYIFMMIIAFTDLAYHLFSVTHNGWYKIYRLYGSTDLAGMYVLIVNKGLMYSVSLASDMCAVILTLERYLAIAKPALHKKLLEGYKTITRRVALLIVVLIGSTRLHYLMDRKVKVEGGKYFYATTEFSQTEFVSGLIFVGDFIVPLVLLVTMLFLSTMFRLAVTKRQKEKLKKAIGIGAASAPIASVSVNRSQVAPLGAPTDRSDVDKAKIRHAAAENELRSMVVLTLALDFLFLLNQLGYCCYFAAESTLTYYKIDFESSYQRLNTWVKIVQWETYTDTVASLTEIVSHAGNFPLYMILSGSIRKDFRNFVKKICKRN